MGGLWSQKPKQVQDPYRDRDIRFGVTIVDPASEKRSASNGAEFVENAKILREQWRPWALQHKDLLKAMAKTDASDLSAVRRVFHSLPSLPTDAGMPPIVIEVHNLDRTLPSNYSWQPGMNNLKLALIHDPVELKDVIRMQNTVLGHVQEQLAQSHDIQLCDSSSKGVSTVRLWASGRITEDTRVHQTIPGKPSLVEGVVHEIAPHYDFLK